MGKSRKLTLLATNEGGGMVVELKQSADMDSVMGGR